MNDAAWEAIKSGESDMATFEVRRDRVERGKSFSVEAMTALRDQMLMFTGARIMAAWERRNSAPQMVRVHVRVEVVE